MNNFSQEHHRNSSLTNAKIGSVYEEAFSVDAEAPDSSGESGAEHGNDRTYSSTSEARKTAALPGR